MKICISLLVLGLAGCAATNPSSTWLPPEAHPSTESAEPIVPATAPNSIDSEAQAGQPSPVPPRSMKPLWSKGQPLMQGFFGVSYYDKVTREGGNFGNVDGDAGDLDQMPLIGGGGQWKLGGEGVDFGLEGLFSFEGRANAAAFAIGGGGAAVAIDVDLFVFDFYGGPFVSKFLGDKLRVYGSAGPLLQWANYNQGFTNGSGFGTGWYGRAGIELVLPSRVMLGLGGMWTDSKLDLSGGLGDLNIEGTQVYLTVTTGF